MRRLVVAPRAQRDIHIIIQQSRDRHGSRAADRYRRLIDLALTQLCNDVVPLSSKPADIGNLRLYALRFAARGLPLANTVRAPVHVIAYQFDDRRVDIVRILHEAMDLPRHLEGATPRNDE